MRTYLWWLGQKKRVQKKYTLFLGRYLSPKEVMAWYKNRMERKGKKNDGRFDFKTGGD